MLNRSKGTLTLCVIQTTKSEDTRFEGSAKSSSLARARVRVFFFALLYLTEICVPFLQNTSSLWHLWRNTRSRECLFLQNDHGYRLYAEQ